MFYFAVFCLNFLYNQDDVTPEYGGPGYRPDSPEYGGSEYRPDYDNSVDDDENTNVVVNVEETSMVPLNGNARLTCQIVGSAQGLGKFLLN